MQQPILAVGIVSAIEIPFQLRGHFLMNGKQTLDKSDWKASYTENGIELNGEIYNEIIISPTHPTDYFILSEVVIGIDFHWERKEQQSFRGALKLIIEGEKITAVNLIEVEEYLKSVISSEMSATASIELLKAHAVISRSWVLSQLDKKQFIESEQALYISDSRNEKEWIKWWDREDHTLYDICADDHCQRYQGLTRESTQKVIEAVEATHGELLMDSNRICDARFSKCCGGVVETFENCWEPTPHAYLQKVFDRKSDTTASTPDLQNEKSANRWIYDSPEAFCNTVDKNILGQVLNNYDQETTDFYRWRVSYTQEQLSALIARKSGIDFGRIIDLVSLERGVSGRIVRLKIVGEKSELIIGKELLIRKILSESHLYSSAFVVEKEQDSSNFPKTFTLIGAGWGHGVGLCQIGAAVMGNQGYNYSAILMHYYRGAEILKRY